MSDPFMVKNTITYSDGSEIVVNYTDNKNREAIEEAVAEATEGDHKISHDVEEVIAPAEEIEAIEE